MASVKIRNRRQRYTDKSVINGVAVATNVAPLNNQVLAYNSTSGYYEYATAQTVETDIAGNITFQDSMQIGTLGTPIHHFDRDVTVVALVATPIAAGGQVTGTVNFASTFPSVPTVILTLNISDANESELVANLTSITTTSFSYIVYNYAASATTAFIVLYWFAIA